MEFFYIQKHTFVFFFIRILHCHSSLIARISRISSPKLRAEAARLCARDVAGAKRRTRGAGGPVRGKPPVCAHRLAQVPQSLPLRSSTAVRNRGVHRGGGETRMLPPLGWRRSAAWPQAALQATASTENEPKPPNRGGNLRSEGGFSLTCDFLAPPRQFDGHASRMLGHRAG
jgi:hypothetical protein